MEETAVVLLGGAHPHAADYLDAVRRRQDATLVAVYDPDGERARRLAAGTAAILAGTVDAALRAGRRSASTVLAAVCSQTAEHADLVAAALGERVPIFVEKPLGLHAAESGWLASVIGNAGMMFGTGFFLRQVSALRRLRDLLAEGGLGRLVSVEVGLTHDGAVQGWFDERLYWMTAPRRSGVGGFGDLGTHLMDLLRFLRPELDEPVVRAAVTGSAVVSRIDDYGTALLAYPDGVPATVTAGWAVTPGGLRVTVSGTRGTADVRDGRLSVADGTDGAGTRVLVDGEPPAAGAAFTAFLDRLATPDGGDPDGYLPLLADVTAAERLVEQSYAAASS